MNYWAWRNKPNPSYIKLKCVETTKTLYLSCTRSGGGIVGKMLIGEKPGGINKSLWGSLVHLQINTHPKHQSQVTLNCAELTSVWQEEHIFTTANHFSRSDKHSLRHLWMVIKNTPMQVKTKVEIILPDSNGATEATKGPLTGAGLFLLQVERVPSWPLPPRPNEYIFPEEGVKASVCCLTDGEQLNFFIFFSV